MLTNYLVMLGLQGHIAAGSDADIVIFDPNEEHTISPSTHHSRIDTNIYEGKAIRGKASLLTSTVV